MQSTVVISKSLILKALLGGILMGLANLVPGISGGTMLLAAGVYTAFIGALAGLSTFHISRANLLVIVLVGGAAVTSIVLFAGPVKGLVVEFRWIMYSWFVGLTLGGAPLIWRMLPDKQLPFWCATVAGIALMVAMGMELGASGGGDSSVTMLFVAGVASSSAMILPGVSGGYLLLLLGQYEAFLGSIDLMKVSLSHAQGVQMAGVSEAAATLVPIVIGIIVGLIAVSNLLKWILRRYEQATLGSLMGLLLGAVFGLWPFQQPVAPQVGDVIRGKVLTADTVAAVPPEKWPLIIFTPTLSQVAICVFLVLLGLLITLGVDWLGRYLEASSADAPS